MITLKMMNRISIAIGLLLATAFGHAQVIQTFAALAAQNQFTATNTFANIIDLGLTVGNCVQASTGGLLVTTVNPCGFGAGTLTQVNTGTGLTGGPCTTTCTISIANTTVTAGSYTNTNLTVNAQGQITAASTGTGGSASPYAALTDGATITWSVSSSVNNAKVTLGGNRTLAITGATSGMNGTLIVTQDATGTRTLALPASSKVIHGGSGSILLSTTAGASDILTWTYDGVNFWWSYGLNYT